MKKTIGHIPLITGFQYSGMDSMSEAFIQKHLNNSNDYLCTNRGTIYNRHTKEKIYKLEYKKTQDIFDKANNAYSYIYLGYKKFTIRRKK